MKLLVTGAGGMLGRALAEEAEGVELVALDRAGLDVTDAEAVRRAVGQHAPAAVVNAAAYTAVDRAEAEPERAFAVNRDGAAHLAVACAEAGLPLLHVSTDYVFDGAKGTPYQEGDAPNPLGVYGQSKWDGEEAVRAALDAHVIVRTAWLFGVHGQSFVKTILRLAGERETLRVVADQRGCPTAAADLAAALLRIAHAVTEDAGRWGTYHLAGHPPTTWHGLAEAVVEEARRWRPLAVQSVEPIRTEDYPTAARRPSVVALDGGKVERAFGIGAPPWRPALGRVVARLCGAGQSAT
ncbi:MAG: dTDP-4-dehydrorhamnose reductase [Rubricoccaceae bacterium]|nr:dTDP-4-dehydrorhamnose reductase [Rubricoccaceae bacterium]